MCLFFTFIKKRNKRNKDRKARKMDGKSRNMDGNVDFLLLISFISQMGLKKLFGVATIKFHVCQFSVVKSGIESTFGRNMIRILSNADGME
jgi:hypothetical protein